MRRTATAHLFRKIRAPLLAEALTAEKCAHFRARPDDSFALAGLDDIFDEEWMPDEYHLIECRLRVFDHREETLLVIPDSGNCRARSLEKRYDRRKRCRDAGNVDPHRKSDDDERAFPADRK